MSQRIFDKNNEKDMQDLFDILPEKTAKIKGGNNLPIYLLDSKDNLFGTLPMGLFKINWCGVEDITRPIQEAIEADVGKLCYFWEGKDFAFGVLKGIGDDSSLDLYCMEDGKGGIWFAHCRRLTKQEIEEIC